MPLLRNTDPLAGLLYTGIQVAHCTILTGIIHMAVKYTDSETKLPEFKCRKVQRLEDLGHVALSSVYLSFLIYEMAIVILLYYYS